MDGIHEVKVNQFLTTYQKILELAIFTTSLFPLILVTLYQNIAYITINFQTRSENLYITLQSWINFPSEQT